MGAYTFAEDVETVRFGLAVIAGIVAPLGVIFGVAWKVGLGRAVRRRSDNRRARFVADVAAVVRPMIDETRAAAKEQHDEQNNAIKRGFMLVHEGLDHLCDRLDSDDDRLAAHDVRLAVIEARNPSTRS